MNHANDMEGVIRDEEAEDPSDRVDWAPGRGAWAAFKRMFAPAATSGAQPPCRSTEDIYRGYGEFVWRKLQKRGVEPGAIEDVYGQVFLTMEEQAGGGELPHNVEAMLTTISSNATMNHRRARKRQRRFVAEAEAEEVPASAPDAEQRLIAAERARIVRDVLAAMPEAQSALIRRLDLDGLTHEALAEDLELPVGTVKTRHRAARARFRDTVRRLYPST
jgi:RNA polymerase sigma-70 factor (ECF subfamily)